MTEPFLKIDTVTKKFGPFTALDHVSLSVEKGEFVCFLGPSGCGKTTLLRAIAGLDIQTSGSVIQDGQDISILPPEQRDFGIVFQSYALFPNLTVTKNIAFGLENQNWSRDKVAQRVQELLDLVGLADHAQKFPSQISGGQQQRVALARALAVSPGLLLLDEPLSALDAKVRQHLRSEIKDLQRRLGVTTIMVTHDQEEALAMADRIVVMNMGVIEQVGTPQEIYSKPSSAFVAKFIGAMNILPAECCPTEEPDCCVLSVGDMDLVATMQPDIVNGPVRVAVRPEDIRIHDGEAKGPNQLPVTIQGLEFMGSFYRADLISEALEGETLEADFSANLVRSAGLTVGDQLTVQLPTEHLHVFPAEAA